MTRRLIPLLTLILAVLSGGLLGWPAVASASPVGPGSLAATGFDLDVEQPARIIAGRPDANLRLVYTAGRRGVREATLVITIPSALAVNGLAARGSFATGGGLPPDLRGTVVVRPFAFGVLGNEGTCAVRGDANLPDDADWSVAAQIPSGDWVITVPNVTCAAGQTQVVKIYGIVPPAEPGVVPIRASVRGPDETVRSTLTAALVAWPEPERRLVLDLPDTLVAGEPTTATVRVVRADGRPAREYRGTVALATFDEDGDRLCSGIAQSVPFTRTFAPSDRGVITFTVTLSVAGRFTTQARDLGEHAQPAEATYQVEFRETAPTCPTAYH